MGIPYSRQINAAFDQVTPLVASAYEVLQTTKNISLLLAAIQILTVIFLALILVVLLGIAYSVNPDLDKERKALVTPTLKWLAVRIEKGPRSRLWWLLIAFVLGGVWAYFWFSKVTKPGDDEEEEEVLPPVESPVDGGEGQVGQVKGKDVDALKKGKSTQ